MKYKAVLFAHDGDWVTDYKGDTKEEVIDQLANGGSRWLFYYLEGIIYDKGDCTSYRQKVLDVSPILPSHMKGKTICGISKWLSSLSDDERYDMISAGY